MGITCDKQRILFIFIALASMSQNENEHMQNYLVHLRARALDCNFTCLPCDYDLSDIYIKGPAHQRSSKRYIPGQSTGQGWNA